jgi:predicted nucleic acid-binding Zn ribbon protein
MNKNILNQENEKKAKQREKVIKLLIYLMALLVITFVIIGL